MYNKIEQEFREKSKRHKTIVGLFVYLFITLIVAFIVQAKMNNVGNGIFFAIAFGSWIIYYIHVFSINRKRNHYKNFFTFFNINKNVKDYNNFLCEQDKEQLNQILTSYKIDTKTKIQESLRHFRTRIPKQPNIGGLLLPFVTLAVSLIVDFYIENGSLSFEKLETTGKALGSVLGIILLVLMAVWFLVAIIYTVQYNFYSSIENLASTIYFEFPTKKPKKKINNKELENKTTKILTEGLSNAKHISNETKEQKK